MWRLLLVFGSGGLLGYLAAHIPWRRWWQGWFPPPPSPRLTRPHMRWEDMDALKARMLREGYPLVTGTPQGNETIWRSLAGRIRRPQLQALMGWADAAIDERVREIRRQRRQVTGRK